MTSTLTRRDFLKLSALGAGTLGLHPWNRFPLNRTARVSVSKFPEGGHLGRVGAAFHSAYWYDNYGEPASRV